MKCLVKGVGAAGIDHDGGLRILALQYHRVGNHTDVADQTNQFDLISSFGQYGSCCRVRYIQAEYQFVDGLCAYFCQSFGSDNAIWRARILFD